MFIIIFFIIPGGADTARCMYRKSLACFIVPIAMGQFTGEDAFVVPTDNF